MRVRRGSDPGRSRPSRNRETPPTSRWRAGGDRARHSSGQKDSRSRRGCRTTWGTAEWLRPGRLGGRRPRRTRPPYRGGRAEPRVPSRGPLVVDPGLVVVVLFLAEPAADGLGGDFAGPLPVRAVQPGRVGAAAAVSAAAAGSPLGDRAGQHHARAGDLRELRGDLPGFGLMSGGDTHRPRLAQVPHLSHIPLYTYSVTSGRRAPARAAEMIGGYRPASLPEPAARFARLTAAACAPQEIARAKALLFACGKLGAFASAAGLELVPEVCLHPSVIERFILTAGRDLSSTTHRTLRTTLRCAARRAGPRLGP